MVVQCLRDEGDVPLRGCIEIGDDEAEQFAGQ